MGFREVGLSESEYKRIIELLGREPNDLELELIGFMWSEHCSYKSTRPLLRTFPSKGKAMGAGKQPLLYYYIKTEPHVCGSVETVKKQCFMRQR